jgi:hypothetical protein
MNRPSRLPPWFDGFLIGVWLYGIAVIGATAVLSWGTGHTEPAIGGVIGVALFVGFLTWLAWLGANR